MTTAEVLYFIAGGLWATGAWHLLDRFNLSDLDFEAQVIVGIFNPFLWIAVGVESLVGWAEEFNEKRRRLRRFTEYVSGIDPDFAHKLKMSFKSLTKAERERFVELVGEFHRREKESKP